MHYPDQPLEVERGVSGSQVAGGYVQGTTTYTTTGKVGQVSQGYVSGQSGAGYATGAQGGYVTEGHTYTTTTGGQAYTTGGQTYTTGGQVYTTGGQTYTTTNPVVYSTGPVQTTYEYVNAPSSSTYVEHQGQRWESSAPYGERATYEYVNYPEGTYVTQQQK